MTGPIFRTYSLVPRDGPGLACDDEGLALGSVTLAKRVRGGDGSRRYRLLSLEDMVHALRLAYGPVPDAVIERRCRGLARVVQLLGVGADALARIYAVLIGFPEIAPDGMAKLAAAASMRKYNPDWEDEPRVPAGNPDGGQWTSDGDSGGEEDAGDTEMAADARRWELCLERCSPLLERPKPYRWSDVNEFAFRKCMNECLAEDS